VIVICYLISAQITRGWVYLLVMLASRLDGILGTTGCSQAFLLWRLTFLRRIQLLQHATVKTFSHSHCNGCVCIQMFPCSL